MAKRAQLKVGGQADFSGNTAVLAARNIDSTSPTTLGPRTFIYALAKPFKWTYKGKALSA